MSDLYLHTLFARRLRFSEGLHPYVQESMVRRSPYLILGASLGALAIDTSAKSNFFTRVFKFGKNDSEKWSERLNPTIDPNIDLVIRILKSDSQPETGPHYPLFPGSLCRISLAFGILSHHILNIALQKTLVGVNDQEKQGIERAQARLWIQNSITSLSQIQDEWAPSLYFTNLKKRDSLTKYLKNVLSETYSAPINPERIGQWIKSLPQLMRPLVENSSLPEEKDKSEYQVRETYFEKVNFVEKSQEVSRKMILLSGVIGDIFSEERFNENEISHKLSEIIKSDNIETSNLDSKIEMIAERRKKSLNRGRNEEAAFDETSISGIHEVSEEQSETATQEVSLAQIQNIVAQYSQKSGEIAVEAPEAHVVEETNIEESSAPPAPTSTQQLSVSELQEAMRSQAPEVEGSLAPPAPTSTQQLSVSELQEAMQGLSSESASSPASAPPAPTSTQQLSVSELQEAMQGLSSESASSPASAPPAPTSTQQLSVSELQEAMQGLSSESASSTASAPPAPTSTQQLSVSELQEAMQGLSSESASSTASAPPAPTSTQQLSVSELQEAMQGLSSESASSTASAPPAPTSTQQLSVSELQEAMQSLSSENVGSSQAPPTESTVNENEKSEALQKKPRILPGSFNRKEFQESHHMSAAELIDTITVVSPPNPPPMSGDGPPILPPTSGPILVAPKAIMDTENKENE